MNHLIASLSLGVLVLGATVVVLGRQALRRWWDRPGEGWDEYGPWLDSDSRTVKGSRGEKYPRPRRFR